MAKSAEAFRTISEVSDYLETPAHVLRFWESRFTQIKPVRRAGGRRYYRPADMALLSGIRKLLHDEGLTIRGVQKILKERGVRHVADLGGMPFTEGAADSEAAPPAPEAETAPGGDAGAPAAVTASEAETATGPATGPTAAPVATGDLFAAMRRAPPRADVSPGAAVRAAMGRNDAAASGDVPEAPMQVDVPTLPAEPGGTVHRLAGTAETRQPAAALLRAMDALRAREKKTELKSIYLRLSELRGRLSGSTGPNFDG